MAQLASTVYVIDPDTRQTVRLEPGTSPEARLAALVTNPAAWVDGRLPAAAKKTAAKSSDDDQGNGQGGGSGGESDSPSAPAGADQGSKPAAKKTAARPARGRKSADEGNS